jgi:hypothetical protein
MKKVETANVEFFAGEGAKAKRVIMQDEYGFFIKHRGMFEAVEKNDEGVWCHVGTSGEAYRKRNAHRYGEVVQTEETPEASVEEPIDGLVAERPYLAIQEMTVRTMHFEHPEDPTFISVIKHENLNRFLRALSHLEIKYYDVKVITDGISITHELIEKPFEEEVETMLEQRKIIPIEIRAKLNLFSRYNELLMKLLKFNLSSEEQDEYNGLYNELKLNEGNNLYELMKASYEQRNA